MICVRACSTSLLLLLLGLATLIATGCKKSGSARNDSTSPDTAIPNNPSPLGVQLPALVKNPDMFLDIRGSFPETKPYAGGYVPRPGEELTIHLILVGTSVKDEPPGRPGLATYTLDYYAKKLDEAAGGKKNRTAKRVDGPEPKTVLQTIHLAPVTDSPETIAKRIDFGTVRKIEGRVITLVVRSENAVIPEELLATLPPTTEPNPRTIDPSKMVPFAQIVRDYQPDQKGAGAKYTGKQQLVHFLFPEMLRDADGKACVLNGTNNATLRPNIVARLANDAGWKEHALAWGNNLFVEGRVVGPIPVEQLPWMKNWASMRQFDGVPGCVVVIEDAKIVTTPPEYLPKKK